jgi:hypothetical protein
MYSLPAFGKRVWRNTIALSTVAASGGPDKTPRGRGAWSVSSAISRVAGSFFSAK